jgi:Na+/proline symporter
MGISAPVSSDDLYPMLALQHFAQADMGVAGLLVGITFLIGITAATYASSDSALTALTTAFCVDFMDIQNKEEKERNKIKNRVHLGFSALFFVVILLFKMVNSTDVISATFQIASYTYGPILGLFTFGMYTKRKTIDHFVPFICVLSPILTYLIVVWVEGNLGYKFGFENLLLNGLITFLALVIFKKKEAIN